MTLQRRRALPALIACFAATSANANSGDDAFATTGNVALVSDYVFRGLTQTWGHAAIEGGGDLAMKNGFAAGFWGSSISDKSYPGAALELDLYASFGTPIGDDTSWRVGLYSYVYPGGNLDEAGLRARTFDTTEANASLTWKSFTLKYSTSLTDYFGIDTEQGYRSDSRGTGYIELDAAISLSAASSLALHAGHTDIPTRLTTPLANGARDPDYSDAGATLKWQFATRWSASLGATYADHRAFYGRTSSFENAADTMNVGGSRGFVMLQGTF